MSDPIGSAIYEALSDAAEELGVTDVYLMGDVPEEATLPYLTYYKRSANGGRISLGYGTVRRTLQIDVLAKDPGEAEDIADGVESLIVGTSVAATGASVPFPGGFERSQGAWRVNDFPEALADGGIYHRIVLLFEQRETATL